MFSQLYEQILDLTISLIPDNKLTITPPDAKTIEPLVKLVAGITLADVGLAELEHSVPTSTLDKDFSFNGPLDLLQPRSQPQIITHRIYYSEDFTICCFILPANTVMPLHNHPNQTVISKVLKGQLHIQSFDWVVPSINPMISPLAGIVNQTGDCVLDSSSPVATLLTEERQMHQMIALSDSVLFDIIFPPYDGEAAVISQEQIQARLCHYYTIAVPPVPLNNPKSQFYLTATNKPAWKNTISFSSAKAAMLNLAD